LETCRRSVLNKNIVFYRIISCDHYFWKEARRNKSRTSGHRTINPIGSTPLFILRSEECQFFSRKHRMSIRDGNWAAATGRHVSLALASIHEHIPDTFVAYCCVAILARTRSCDWYLLGNHFATEIADNAGSGEVWKVCWGCWGCCRRVICIAIVSSLISKIGYCRVIGMLLCLRSSSRGLIIGGGGVLIICT
jgi:hypothetical protein